MKSTFPLAYIRFQCDMIGSLFVYSAREGIDSDDFCYKLITSRRGSMILTDHFLHEYCGASFMFQGLEREISFKQGSSYDTDILYFTGYLYKYWISTRGVSPKDVYKLAPISLIARRYTFYHTQGYDYVINDILDRPYKDN